MVLNYKTAGVIAETLGKPAIGLSTRGELYFWFAVSVLECFIQDAGFFPCFR